MNEPTPPAPTRLPGVIVVIVAVALLAYITYNSLSSEGGSSQGPAVGAAMLEFAAPLVSGELQGDANVRQRSAGGKAACDVGGAAVLNSCRLVASRPAALAFIEAGEGSCAQQLDRLLTAAAGYRSVAVAAIVIAGQRDEARSLVSTHKWTVPVAWDRDAALANLYGVAVCPQIVFLRRGGIVDSVTVGGASTAELRRRLAAIAQGS